MDSNTTQYTEPITVKLECNGRSASFEMVKPKSPDDWHRLITFLLRELEGGHGKPSEIEKLTREM